MYISKHFTWSRTTSFLAATAAFSVVTLNAQLAAVQSVPTSTVTPEELLQPAIIGVPPVGPPMPYPEDLLEEYESTHSANMYEAEDMMEIQPDEYIDPYTDDYSSDGSDKMPDTSSVRPMPMERASNVQAAVVQLLIALENEYRQMGQDGKAGHMRQMVQALQQGSHTSVIPMPPEEMHSAGTEMMPPAPMPMPEVNAAGTSAPMATAPRYDTIRNDLDRIIKMATYIVDAASEQDIELEDDVIDAFERALYAHSKVDVQCVEDNGQANQECMQAFKAAFEALSKMERSIVQQAEEDGDSIKILIQKAQEQASE